jgi:hypothetical protein
MTKMKKYIIIFTIGEDEEDYSVHMELDYCDYTPEVGYYSSYGEAEEVAKRQFGLYNNYRFTIICLNDFKEKMHEFKIV